MVQDAWNIRIDDLVKFDDGTVAVVVAPSEDGRWVPVQYVGGPDDWLIGQHDLAHVDEIAAVVPSHLN